MARNRLLYAARRRLRATWRPWVRTVRTSGAADPLDGFRFHAMIGSWMEADIIEATVRNAFTQGCDAVFVMDNESPDDTVARAEAAGATIAGVFRTERHDPAERATLLNAAMAQISEESGAEHVWWLWADADELVHGPNGSTVREHLAALDRRYRIVGVEAYNHLPSDRPANISGFHPIDLQPLCYARRAKHCPEGTHWKHSLQRWDRTGPPIESGNGAHRARSSVQLFEPPEPVILHHFQYRNEETTRARMEALFDGHRRATHRPESEMAHRRRDLDAVYAQRWADVTDFNRDRAKGVQPLPWTEVLDPAHQPFARWYTPADLDAAVSRWRAERETVRDG